ncbi:alpha/beta hydrolase [Actinoplanes sp. NPDC051851]|uniref:alpha/beta hydrolase n=1 Tax=Actinoplanes sp. NPDC051851 TaxID=3154753 RepID=UPI0034492ABB
MSSLSRLLAALVLTGSVLLMTPAPGYAAATVVTTTVDVPCGTGTLHQAVDWYFPTTTSPKALIYLQHGFSRSKSNMADLAGEYQTAGYLVFVPTLPSSNANNCTVNNTGSNTTFLTNVAAWFGTATSSTGNLAVSYATAATTAGRAGSTLPTTFILAGHSAGGEAVTYVAGVLATTYPAAYANLKFLQLLDPVESPSGTNMATGLTAVGGTSLPVRTVSSPPYLANGQASGTVELTATLDRDFLGVRLTTGSHCDAEGSSTNFLCTLTAGASKAANVTALQTFAVAWANDAVAGTTTATYYPGGTYYQSLLTAGTIETLSGD